MKLLTLSLLILALAVPSVAQTSDQPIAYFAGAGMGFCRTSNPQTTGGLIFGMRAANTENTFAVLQYDNITGETSTVMVNILQYLSWRGNWGLFAIGGGGTATNDGQLLGAFSGGGGMSLKLKALWGKLDGLTLSGAVKALKITGPDPTINQARLQFSGWITKSF
jgi:hypothetical protein